MRNRLAYFLFSFCLFSFAISNAKAEIYNFLTINYPAGSIHTYLWGVNDSEQIVGGLGGNSFIYENGTFNSIEHPDASGSGYTQAYGINNQGHVVGMYFDSSSTHGFLYDGSNYSTIDYPGTNLTQVTDINDVGTMVGTWNDESGARHGFIYNGTAFTTVDYPGAIETIPMGINNGSEIVGGYFDSTGSHAFHYDGSEFVTIEHSSANIIAAYGINDAGQIVGWVDDSSGAHGFFYNGSTFNLIDSDIAEIIGTRAMDINNSGQIVGIHWVDGTWKGFLATPITNQRDNIIAWRHEGLSGPWSLWDIADQAYTLNSPLVFKHPLGTVSGSFSNPSGQVAADNFILFNNTTINQVTWYGYYGTDLDPAITSLSFDIHFFEDNAGLPGAELYNQTFLASIQNSGYQVMNSNNTYYNGRIIYEFRTNLSPTFSVTAGDTFWIEIAENDSSTPAAGDTQWIWSRSIPGDEPSIYGIFIGHDYDGDDMKAGSIATDIYHAFEQLGYAPDPILITDEPTPQGYTYPIFQSRIRDAIDKIRESITPNDILFIYIAGHGTKSVLIGYDETTVTIGDEYIFLNEQEKFIGTYLLTDDELSEMLNGLENIQKWVLVDACRSGGFWGNYYAGDEGDLEKLSNIGLFAAAAEDGASVYMRVDELPITEDPYRNHPDFQKPLFGIAVREALTRKENGNARADIDDNGILTFDELTSWVQNDARQYLPANNGIHLEGVVVRTHDIDDPIVFSWDEWNPEGIESDDFTGTLITKSPNSAIVKTNGPYSSVVGQAITFDASGSYSPNGDIVLYEWDIDNDEVFDISTNSLTIEYTYFGPYIGTVKLRVTDILGFTDKGGASMAVLSTLRGDHDNDCDVDGSNLAAYIMDQGGISLSDFAADFGKADCL